MPENPELVNALKFENGSSSGSGDLSQKRRSDCNRNVSNHPEHNKLKISRGDHPQRSSHYVENQVMVKSPSCWIDPFQTKLDKRRATEITKKTEPLLRDVIELKQAALWHGGKIRVDQASEAAAEGMTRQSKAPRISFRSEGTSSSSVTHQERATSSQTSHPPSCASSSSAVELPQMSVGTCREQSSTDASDSSMCGSNCASRLERASDSSRKISRRKANFLVAPILVADKLRSHSFYSPVKSDVSGRNSREETTGSTGDKKSPPLGESGTTGCGEERKIPQPETFADSDTSDHRSRPGAIQTTTNGRLGNADFGLSVLHRTESVSRERIPGMDDVSVMWSPLESKDGPGRHSGAKRLITGQPQRTPPYPGCASTTRLQQMTNKTKTFFGCSRFTLCKRVENTSLTMESRVSQSAHSVFSSSAFGGAGDGTGLRLSLTGRELQNVECSSRTSCTTTGTTIASGTATTSFVFWHHGSGSTTGDRSNVSRPTAEGQGEQGSSYNARHNAEDLNNTGVLQSVRVWTDKTDDNADIWEAAIDTSTKSVCHLAF